MARLRQEMGMTQRELADRLGVTTVTVHRWEREGAFPRDHLGPLIAALGSTRAYVLLGEAGEAGEEEYAAFSEFLTQLESMPEKALVRDWMIESLRSVRLPAHKVPTVAMYRQMLIAMLLIDEA